MTLLRLSDQRSAASSTSLLARAPRTRGEGQIGERQARILIVDDDSDIRELLHHTVDAIGYANETASNADEALVRIRQGGIDLITLDLAMPGRDGHWLLRELQADSTISKIPIIVVSAYAGRLVRTPQVTAVLWKPYDVDELERAIKAALRLA